MSHDHNHMRKGICEHHDDIDWGEVREKPDGGHFRQWKEDPVSHIPCIIDELLRLKARVAELEVSPLDTALDQALADDNLNGDVFSGDEDISARQQVEAERDEAREALAIAQQDIEARDRRIAELEARPVQVVSVSSPEAGETKIIPEEIAALMEDGETLPQARKRLTELLFVELAELKNLRGVAGEDLKREAEIEKLLGLFARLGEI